MHRGGKIEHHLAVPVADRGRPRHGLHARRGPGLQRHRRPSPSWPTTTPGRQHRRRRHRRHRRARPRRHRARPPRCRSWRARRCCSSSSAASTRCRSASTCTDVDEIVETVVAAGPELRRHQPGGHLARRAASRSRTGCASALDIPVFHDDQHGTAIVALAALRNAARLTGRELGDLRVVVCRGRRVRRRGDEDPARRRASATSRWPTARAWSTRPRRPEPGQGRAGRRSPTPPACTGSIEDALRGADVFIGLSGGTVRRGRPSPRWRPDAIVFALANPDPEIHPDVARRARRGGRHRPQRLPQPDQQRAGLPGRLPRRARRPRDRDHRGHEAGRRATPSPRWSATTWRRTTSIPSPFDPRVAPAVAAAVAAAGPRGRRRYAAEC